VSTNTRNRGVCSKAKSKYNGVTLDEKSGRWRTTIWFNKTTKYIGSFTEEIKAAEAFNNFCKEHKLNRELNTIAEA
jgi:hypothetical protein